VPLGLAAWLLVFFVGGGACLARARAAAPGSDDGVRTSAAALAAATPFRRFALAAEAANLMAPDASGDTLERALRLYEILGDPTGTASARSRLCIARAAVLALTTPEEGSATYTACGLAPPPDVFFAMGRWMEASAASRPEDEQSATDPAHLLRMAEAHLAAHQYERSADAIVRYAALVEDADPDRRAVRGCMAQAVRARAPGHALPSDFDRARAACKVLQVDLLPQGARAPLLGTGDFVWGDAQGMEFAKLLLNRIVQALLIEERAFDRISPDVFKYALYPDAYLAAMRPSPTPSWGLQHFDLGNDVEHMVWYERTHLEEHPYAIWRNVSATPEHEHDPDEVRMHASAHIALLFAAAGDAEGAKRVLDQRVRVIPDGLPSAYWKRPTADAVAAVVNRLARGEAPYRFDGSLFGALTAATDRANAGSILARGELPQFVAALTDRTIAVPLLLLEAFARK
jgi:hypothetical protein